MTWWRDAVLYQIYPRSYADADGDGVGDLRGITGRLDHLAWLGVDAIWLSPIHPSPDADWGYDVSDYRGVHPDLGSLDDFDDLVREATDRGIRVLLDLVPNHTSDAHEWFRSARSSPASPFRDYYVWADPGPDGAEPNNWVSNFGGPAWALDEASGQYFLHNFLAEQPDLNWWNEDVRAEFDGILGFWFDRGVSGFRIDVCHMIVKDDELRDNPPVDDDAHFMERLRGQYQTYNSDRPEVHDVLARWRDLARGYDPERLLLGEVYLLHLERWARYYGETDRQLQLAFNFPFVHTAFEAEALASVVDEVEALVPDHAWPAWTGSNHDVGRLATRWGQGDEARARLALTMLLTLRGTPVLYYGDEIALEDVPLEYEQLLDPVGLRFHPYAGRDPCRTPMVWSTEPGAGFTAGASGTWLPVGSLDRNVAEQRAAPASTLNFCRDLIALRRATEDLRRAPYEPIEAPSGAWCWRRGSATVALNLSDDGVQIDGVTGTVTLSTTRALDGQALDGSLELGPWEGVVIT